jgi:phage baseplate assembly protein W
MAAKSINIKFPFTRTESGGVFGSNTTTEAAITSDLIAFLTLRRGSRPMQPNLYSPVFDFLFESLDEIMQSRLREDIIQKVAEFFPNIEIKNIKFTPKPDLNLLSIKIVFGILQNFGAEQTIELNIPIDPTDEILNSQQ